ncbi:hypothetical protein RI367_007084 [Sorochytrium milnesiophthora]
MLTTLRLLALTVVCGVLGATSGPISDADVKAFFDTSIAPLVSQKGPQAIGMTYFSFPDGSDTPRLVSYSAGTCYDLDGKATGAPQPSTTIFRIGSVTKVFTGTALWQLHEQGRLDLDARIDDLLPSLASRMKGHVITVRDVLQHTVPLDANLISALRPGDGMPPLSTLEGVEKHMWTAWVAPPDAPKRISYSNEAVSLGGAIIEAVTGTTLDDYVRQHITGPLGANQTAFHRELHGDYSAVCYPADARKSYGSPNEVWGRSTGDLYATTGDVARFLAAQVASNSVLFAKNDTAATMRTRVYPSTDILPDNVYHGVANLWGLESYRGVRIVSKPGDLPESSGIAFFFPDTKDGIYIVATPMGSLPWIPYLWVTAVRSNTASDADQPLPPTAMTDWQASALFGQYRLARSASKGISTVKSFFEHWQIVAVADNPFGAIDVGAVHGKPPIRYISVGVPNPDAARVIFASAAPENGTYYLIATFDAATKKIVQVEMPAHQSTMLPLRKVDDRATVLSLVACAVVIELASIVAFCIVPLCRVVLLRVRKGQWTSAPFFMRPAGFRSARVFAAQQVLQLVLAFSSIVLLAMEIVLATTPYYVIVIKRRYAWVSVAVCFAAQLALVFGICLCVVLRVFSGDRISRMELVAWAALFVLNVCSIPGLVWSNIVTMRFW